MSKRSPFPVYFKAVLPLSAALLLGACVTTTNLNQDRPAQTAQTIAAPAHMQRRAIPAPPFILTSFEHISAPGQEADIYIEGDGLAWLSRTTPSLDPTPKDPVALHLAAQDPAANVIYMARPCQYSKTTDPQTACHRRYWMGARFAPETVESMNAALDDIKARYHIPAFHLIGYSGGGSMAALLAARRSDVASLRTVAGNLDHARHSQIHDVSPLSASLNPRAVAAQIATIPQIHFIGAEDDNVTPALYDSFARAAGSTACLQRAIIPGASHDKGWVERWSALLAQAPNCSEYSPSKIK